MSGAGAERGRGTGTRAALAALLLALAMTPLLPPAPAAAAGPSAAEAELARTYAPVVRLQDQPRPCEAGEPYEPTDIDLLMGNDEIALRGPWDTTNIVAVAPTADRLGRGLPGYHLDFPGDPLRPGCTYEEWSIRLRAEAPPTTYARVVTQDGVPGRLALQYWFFYVFNDWNNTHEGDWEMVQLNFDAATPAAALARGPSEVGYSQHSSAERADWGDGKLQVVGGTHPVVHPAAGSHANFFSSDLYLMRSDQEGVGCDDTTGPSRTIRPVVDAVPTAPADYLDLFPWLGFQGRWGEQQASFFNGPTGPNLKTQWTEPFTWASESWRSESFAVPAGGALGTSATDFFCGAVERASLWLRDVKANPGRAALVLGGLGVLLLWGLSRTVWEPTAPLPAARRRRWGQLVAASVRIYGRRPRVFLGIGLLFIPLGLIITGVQFLVFRVSSLDALVDEAGERNAFVDALALGLGLLFTLLGFAIVSAATARAMEGIDRGERVTAISAYRAVLPRLWPLVGALAILVALQVVLGLTVVLLPVAVFVLVRWSLLAVAAGVEGGGPIALLRRSARLARGHWWRTASIVLVAAVALLLGPAVGVLVLLFTGAAFDLVNLIAALVYVAALPFAAVVTTYLYFDLRERAEAAPAEEPSPGAISPA
jgi:hypothetical protein